MLFSSWQFFALFLPITVIIYFLLNSYQLHTTGKVWLVAASLFFYGYWDIWYLPLIVASTVFNFALGSAIGQRGRNQSKRLLSFGIGVNLVLLAYHKYLNFSVDSINWAIGTNFQMQGVILPLAISFFTFTQIVYLVDSYRGETRKYNFLNYTLFVMFFPHLIAGPIVHHGQIMPQFGSPHTLKVRYDNILAALFIFSIGLFKKVVIADTFAAWATAGFDSAGPIDFFSAWATSLSYTFQLYFDFSGYCDMAIGASLLFNIWLPVNFNSPYKALDIQDFWRRWHITLSSFLRDYLYIPMGGNRGGVFKTYLLLLITFLLGGLWHGSTWMFVMWGAMHGLGIVIHRIWKKVPFSLPTPFAWLLTFVFVT